MFSSRGELVSEALTIAMWSSVRDFVAILNPCGQPGTNPNKENAGHVTLRFDQLNVVYPPHDKIVEYALQAAWMTPEAREARSATPTDKVHFLLTTILPCTVYSTFTRFYHRMWPP